MKVVSLCSSCSQCPVVRVTDEEVEIGEKATPVSLPRKSGRLLKIRYLRKNYKLRISKSS